MEDLLKVHPKAYNKVYILYYIILTINLVLFILVTINYCLSFYAFNYKEENYPDIEITGIKSFKFVSLLDDFEYSPGMSNLGNTGKVYLDCFIGECIYSYSYDCSEDGETTCTAYDYIEDHGCSDECRKTRFNRCSHSFCNWKFFYHYKDNRCLRDNDDDELTKTKSCNADNLILNWKKLFYNSTNATSYGKYTYLNSAISSNESCPIGKKNCGILDELGNILCLPTFEECPINLVTTNRNEIIGYSSYDLTRVGDKTIYYTNQSFNQKVIEGIFVDSDLMLKYNGIECKILDTSTISELLQHNYNKLYRNSLKFDPYDEEADELDKRGKSYLKACSPGIGKEKNITKMKELSVEYKLNITNNRDIIKPIKVLFIVSYFISLPGYIVSIFFLFVFLSSFNFQNNIKSITACGCDIYGNTLLIIILFISYFFTIVGSILSLINNLHNLVDGFNLELSSNIISTLIIINYITFSLNMLLILLFLVFIIYLLKTPELGSDQISYYEKSNYKKPINADFTTIQSDQKFVIGKTN